MLASGLTVPSVVGPQPVPEPPLAALVAVALADAIRQITQSLNDCFAPPVAQRVLAVDLTIPASATFASAPDIFKLHRTREWIALDAATLRYRMLDGSYKDSVTRFN